MGSQFGAIATLLALLGAAAAQTAIGSERGVTRQNGRAGSMSATLGRLPLYFVENRGVYPEEVKYYIQGADKTLFFTKDGVTIHLNGGDRGWTVKLDFVGANADALPEGADRQQAVFSYFKGPEKDWKTGLGSFSKVVYRGLWPGIDLVYSGAVNALKYEFIVAPGADPSRIRLRYRGAEGVCVTDRSALRVETPEGSFEDAPPVAWQEIDGKRVPVEMRYALAESPVPGTHEFGFHLGEYDTTQPLVLDPAMLVYCGYIGGSERDFAKAIAVDDAGNAYVVGMTSSTEGSFPVKVGPFLSFPSSGTQQTVFIAKVNAAGTALVYCGYIGGLEQEEATAVAVDRAGNAYLTGWTASAHWMNFPVKTGPNLRHNGGTDAFVAKLNPQGTQLVYCGYIGGYLNEGGSGIAVDEAGNAYITGWTGSSEYRSFPVRVGPDLSFNGGTSLNPIDAFVAKVNAAGTALVYCGYIGGSDDDWGTGIAVDAAGNAYVVGTTSSNEGSFPVKVGPDVTYNGAGNGCGDCFVAKVNPAGTGLVYCGYIGGGAGDDGRGIAVDAGGGAYVTGTTYSNEQTFPVVVGPDLTHNQVIPWCDAFIAKVNAAGSALEYCGYIGGSSGDQGFGIAVDGLGQAYVTGGTESNEGTFPVKLGPDLTHNGGEDAFVARVSANGTQLLYCGYIGGSIFGCPDERGNGIAVDGSGSAYIAGETRCDEKTFPVTVGPDLTYNGSYRDGFIAKVSVTEIIGSGATRPGSKVDLLLYASGGAGLRYQVGSSFGNGPILIDTRRLELSPDTLLFLAVWGVSPAVFQSYAGILDAQGKARAAIGIPSIPSLTGIRIYTAFVTLKTGAPAGVESISNTIDFTIDK